MERLIKISEYCYKIPKAYKVGMKVDGLIFSDEELIKHALKDGAVDQVANVAFLPGVVGSSLAMPDIHTGYGFCIGGVAAMDPGDGGVISPGGVGYDINCGIRLIKTRLTKDEVIPRIENLITRLYQEIPAGVGQENKKYSFSKNEINSLMEKGPAYLLKKHGLGAEEDIDFCESQGCLANADPDKVSKKAITRGEGQCGTLGSGNHFLEVQVVKEIVDYQTALEFGLFLDQVCIMIHSGSRGLGHQVCDDYLKSLKLTADKYGIKLPDKQLSCAPIDSKEGRDYYGAMAAAANFAWANRHLLMVQTRDVFEEIFGSSWRQLGMELLYDVAHNIAKFETHEVEGKKKTLLVHRKGATRAFPAGSKELPPVYQETGQPVLIPGSMGTSSWIMLGQEESMKRTFGSSCHGAGRRLSRKDAVRDLTGRLGERNISLAQLVQEELESQGICAMAKSKRELAEEQPRAYKDVDLVVNIMDGLGVLKKVARLSPLGVIKG